MTNFPTRTTNFSCMGNFRIVARIIAMSSSSTFKIPLILSSSILGYCQQNSLKQRLTNRDQWIYKQNKLTWIVVAVSVSYLHSALGRRLWVVAPHTIHLWRHASSVDFVLYLLAQRLCCLFSILDDTTIVEFSCGNRATMHLKLHSYSCTWTSIIKWAGKDKI